MHYIVYHMEHYVINTEAVAAVIVSTHYCLASTILFNVIEI